MLRCDDLLTYREKRVNIGASGFMHYAAKKDWDIVPLLWCFAEPAGMVTDNAFERIMGLVAAGLSDGGPFDGVYLDLHGAMVVGDYLDGETEILRRVKAI
ncbi:MAG: M81 family metallopeptidase, partial [Anaerolineaceae bacterium]|nr:M81 family metallopeptidase [Anaerolineaceae bacterium]